MLGACRGRRAAAAAGCVAVAGSAGSGVEAGAGVLEPSYRRYPDGRWLELLGLSRRR